MQYILESSITGKLDYINYWRSSQYLNQGDLVFSVIPENSGNHVVRSSIISLNSGKLKVGQKAIVTAISCLLMLRQAGSWVLIIFLFLAVNPDLEKLKFEVRKF